MPSSSAQDATWACRRYEAVRGRLPRADFPQTSRRVGNLSDIAGDIDVFVLDGYGVLNIGNSVIPGAPERIAALRAAGKRLVVLTNGATRAPADRLEKYRSMGFDFAPDEMVSSRDALARGMADRRDLRWGFAATVDSEIGTIAPNAIWLRDDPADYAGAQGFVLLSTGAWNADRQALLMAALETDPRPVLVGNPDLVAPREDGFTIEPGKYAHEIADTTGIIPEFFGKPFRNAFNLVAERICAEIPPDRIAMVGDTLHTDVLGGAAMGWKTVLVLDHGLLKGVDPARLDEISDIRPHFIADTT